MKAPEDIDLADIELADSNGTMCKRIELESAIRNFAEPEIMRGTNVRFCDRCKMSGESTKYVRLTKEPEILVCHMLRPSVEAGTLAAGKSEPQLSVKFENKLKLTKIFQMACDFPTDKFMQFQRENPFDQVKTEAQPD